jgi:hypothetical protein
MYDHSILFENLTQAAQDGLEVVRIFLQVYSDECPIMLQRKKRGLHTIVVSYGNQNPEELQHQDAYSCIGMFPKGVNFMDCMEVWVPEIEKIQNGFRVDVGSPNAPKLILICGGVGLGKMDMPERLKAAGALSQRAYYPDHMSHVHRDHLSQMQDVHNLRKTQTQVRAVRLDQKGHPDKKQLQAFGLAERPSVFEKASIWFDTCQQLPPMTEHAEHIGCMQLALQTLLQNLEPRGCQQMGQLPAEQSQPPHWQALEAPVLSNKGTLSLGAVDVKHLFQILPFVLHGSVLDLPPKSSTRASRLLQQAQLRFKKTTRDEYRRAQGYPAKLYDVFAKLAWSQKLLCAHLRESGSPERDLTSLDQLEAVVHDGRKAFLEMWPEKCNRPNFWAGVHYADSTNLFGVPSVLNLCMEEGLHGVFKEMVTAVCHLVALLCARVMYCPYFLFRSTHRAGESSIRIL